MYDVSQRTLTGHSDCWLHTSLGWFACRQPPGSRPGNSILICFHHSSSKIIFEAQHLLNIFSKAEVSGCQLRGETEDQPVKLLYVAECQTDEIPSHRQLSYLDISWCQAKLTARPLFTSLTWTLSLRFNTQTWYHIISIFSVYSSFDCRDVPVCDIVQLHGWRGLHRSRHAASKRWGGLRGRQGVHHQSRHWSFPLRAEQRKSTHTIT